MLDRLSNRSEIASLLLRMTVSLPMNCKYRTSVPFRRGHQSCQENGMTSKNTMVVGQRRESLPNRDAHGEIQDISKNRVTFWARWVRESSFLPRPSEDYDWDAKHQRTEHRSVEHGSRGTVRGYRAGSYISGPLLNTAIAVAGTCGVFVRQPRNRTPSPPPDRRQS